MRRLKAFRARGVDTTTGYMNDMSDHPLFQEYKRSCPNATEANANLLHIPVHPDCLFLIGIIDPSSSGSLFRTRVGCG